MPSLPAPRTQRLIHVIYNPRLPDERGVKMHKALHWNDPDQNAQGVIHDLREASHGYVNYKIVERLEFDAFPVKKDGFRYTRSGYANNWVSRAGWHQPDDIDYHQVLRESRFIEKLNRDEVDEIWVSAFPYAGLYESRMGGPGAFWCNAPPLENSSHAKKRFIIMGFNFERGIGEMLENFGHRAESILERVFQNSSPSLWKKFTRYDKTHPGQAEVGNVHFAPNSLKDYDWGNPRTVLSRAHTWLNFPDLSGSPKPVDGRSWGWGDIREHHLWWFRHFPHINGEAEGIAYNWWSYVLDPNQVAI